MNHSKTREKGVNTSSPIQCILVKKDCTYSWMLSKCVEQLYGTSDCSSYYLADSSGIDITSGVSYYRWRYSRKKFHGPLIPSSKLLESQHLRLAFTVWKLKVIILRFKVSFLIAKQANLEKKPSFKGAKSAISSESTVEVGASYKLLLLYMIHVWCFTAYRYVCFHHTSLYSYM